jgi:transcriptional regulator with XRE-family HTH domain
LLLLRSIWEIEVPLEDSHSRLRAQIRAGRELMGMKQADLAEMLDVSLSKVSRAESGETKSGDILLELKRALEQAGVRFTASGVERVENRVELIEGKGCYLKLLDRVERLFAEEQIEDRTLYVMFASDKVSTDAVNERYRRLRAQGVKMRQLISKADNYIMGELEEYRQIPAEYFTNIVTVIFADKLAQVNGDETTVTVQHDAALAQRERLVFSYFWDTGSMPVKSIAEERF